METVVIILALLLIGGVAFVINQAHQNHVSVQTQLQSDLAEAKVDAAEFKGKAEADLLHLKAQVADLVTNKSVVTSTLSTVSPIVTSSAGVEAAPVTGAPVVGP